MRQLKLFHEKQELEFGGSLNLGVRKRRRPIFTQSPSHFVFKAEQAHVLLPNREKIEETIRRQCLRFQIELIGIAIHADHIHLILQILDREIYNKWVRAVTGLLSRRFKIKWRLRPYNRRVSWGRQLKVVKDYLNFNQREAQMILESHEAVDRYRGSVALAV